MLGQNDFISKALTTNYTNVFPLADVDLMVPAAEAQTLDHLGAKVTRDANKVCVSFYVVVQDNPSIKLLATIHALCTAFIFSGCLFVTASNVSSSVSIS